MSMEEKRLKVRLELHVVGDGRRFLNYWDVNGDDVVAEVLNNKLIQTDHDTEAKTEITLDNFIEQVKERF